MCYNLILFFYEIWKCFLVGGLRGVKLNLRETSEPTFAQDWLLKIVKFKYTSID